MAVPVILKDISAWQDKLCRSHNGWDVHCTTPQTATKVTEAEAELDKSLEMVFIPIFILKVKTNKKEALHFMKKISSKGKVFNVSGFDSLVSLQEILLDKVVCGGKTARIRNGLFESSI